MCMFDQHSCWWKWGYWMVTAVSNFLFLFYVKIFSIIVENIFWDWLILCWTAFYHWTFWRWSWSWIWRIWSVIYHNFVALLKLLFFYELLYFCCTVLYQHHDYKLMLFTLWCIDVPLSYKLLLFICGNFPVN